MSKQTEKFLSLKYDAVFREVFSHEDILRHFISDVTGIPFGEIRSARVINPFLWKRYRNQKQGIMDVAVLLNDNTRVDVELQIRPQKYWVKRNLFYLSKMYTDDLRVGQKYERLRKCISISILDFNLVEGERYHSVYTLKDRDGAELTDLFEVHILELNKKLCGDGGVEDWIRVFNVETGRELDALRTENKGVQKAVEVVRTMNLGRTLRAMYEAHLKAVRDRWAEDDYVRDEGRAEGRAEGEALGKADGILQLLSIHGEVPDELREHVMAQKDIKILTDWLLLAAKAGSIPEFEDLIGNILQKKN